jgi:hypothetical protein
MSLKSQFNHALDIRVVENIYSHQSCLDLGKTITQDLKSFNREVETKYSCELNSKDK